MNDFARQLPFLTGFLITGIIVASAFTGGAALLIPAAMFSTIAYASFIVSAFFAVFGAAFAMGGETVGQKGVGLLVAIGFGTIAFACQAFPLFGVAIVGVLLSFMQLPKLLKMELYSGDPLLSIPYILGRV